MSIINVHEIKARFSHYARLVRQGQSFVISYRNRPFGRLVPLEAARQASEVRFGVLSGMFEVPEDFDEPLPELERALEGE